MNKFLFVLAFVAFVAAPVIAQEVPVVDAAAVVAEVAADVVPEVAIVGEVVAVDAAAGTIAVKTIIDPITGTTEEKTFTLSAEVMIQGAEGMVALADVKVGANVTVVTSDDVVKAVMVN